MKYKEKRMKLNVEGHGDCHSLESFQSEDPNAENGSNDSHGIEDGLKAY